MLPTGWSKTMGETGAVLFCKGSYLHNNFFVAVIQIYRKKSDYRILKTNDQHQYTINARIS
jgi:hypothetical protein